MVEKQRGGKCAGIYGYTIRLYRSRRRRGFTVSPVSPVPAVNVLTPSNGMGPMYIRKRSGDYVLRIHIGPTPDLRLDPGVRTYHGRVSKSTPHPGPE